MDIFSQTLVLIVSTVIMIGICNRLKLPSIVGYIAAGMLIGPNGLGWIPEQESFHFLAEFGIVFLLFTIGLEFSLSRLIAIHKVLFGLGSSQVFITGAIAMLCGHLYGLSISENFIIASCIALSSTAVTLKQLSENSELHHRHGRYAVSILLFQDLAAILILLLIPEMGLKGQSSFTLPLLTTLFMAISVLLIMFYIGRWVLRPIFHEVARANSAEFFMFAALLVILVSAWATKVMGLSYVFGAFIAGLLLGETEYRHQLETDIRPFRDVLLGLFFLTVGMLINLSNLPEYWYWSLLLAAILMLTKCFIIFVLLRGTIEKNTPTAFRSGLVLCQSGEFGLAIIALANINELINPNNAQIILAAVTLSMALAPIIIRYNHRITNALFPNVNHVVPNNHSTDLIDEKTQELTEHVIICGYGRVGQMLGKFLETEGIPSIALDHNPASIRNAVLAGERLFYGNAGRLDILKAAGLERCKMLVLSFDNDELCLKILRIVRQDHPTLPILVRSRDTSKRKELLNQGATDVVAETEQASLMLAMEMLVRLGLKKDYVIQEYWLSSGIT